MSDHGKRGEAYMLDITREQYDQYVAVHKAGWVTMVVLGVILANTNSLSRIEVLELMQNQRYYDKKFASPIIRPDGGVA